MRTIKLYVEGKGDFLFVIHLLEAMFGYKLSIDIRKLQAHYSEHKKIYLSVGTFTTQEGHGGIDSTKINAVLKQINDVDSRLGVESVFLIDADTKHHVNPPGGIEARSKHMEELKKSTDFKYFLIPTNEIDGNLETILQSIICTSDPAGTRTQSPCFVYTVYPHFRSGFSEVKPSMYRS